MCGVRASSACRCSPTSLELFTCVFFASSRDVYEKNVGREAGRRAGQGWSSQEGLTVLIHKRGSLGREGERRPVWEDGHGGGRAGGDGRQGDPPLPRGTGSTSS